MRDVDTMIERLLDMDIVNKDDSVVFSDEAKKLIHEIAMECQKMPIVQENMKKIAEYGRGLTAEDVYVDMLHKIVEAPTKIHTIMSARLLVPVIDRKLMEVQNEHGK